MRYHATRYNMHMCVFKRANLQITYHIGGIVVVVTATVTVTVLDTT
jgi:hypothetical protein